MIKFNQIVNYICMTFTLICRSLILYIIILFLLRLMGKRQIGEMQPFELVITLIIADLATIPMAETTLPLIQGIIPLITLVSVHYLICFLSRKSVTMRKFFSGKPIILVDPNGINYKNLQRVNMNFNDLTEGIHGAGYFNLDELLYVILQTNGTMTIVNRSPYSPVTAEDLKLDKPPATLPMIIINKGKVIKENLVKAQIDENFLINEVSKVGISSLKNILILTMSNTGKIYVQAKGKSFSTIQSNYQGGNW